MTPTSWGWFVLAFPLAGTLVISLGWRSLPGRLAGWLASGMILGSCPKARSFRLTKCALRQASMPTIHGGSCSNVSAKLNRLIFFRRAIFPPVSNPTR